MKKILIVFVLFFVATKVFCVPVNISSAQLREKRAEAIKIVQDIAKNFADKGEFPNRETIKKLYELRTYLPKGYSKEDKDFTDMVKVLDAIPKSVLEEPKTDEEKKAFEKYKGDFETEKKKKIEDAKKVDSSKKVDGAKRV